MRAAIVATGVMLASALTRAAQAEPASSPETVERTLKDAVYVEAGGPGLFYSLNYERRFGDCAARLGFGYLALRSHTDSSSSSPERSETESFFAIPLTVSYLGVGSQQDMLELGAGAAVYHRGSGAFGRGIDAATALVPSAQVGYRRQPLGAGFLFRVGLSVLAETDHHFDFPAPILPWPYLAVGGAFQ